MAEASTTTLSFGYYRVPLIFLATNFVFLFVTFTFKLFDVKKRYHLLFIQYIIFGQGTLLLISRFLWRKFTSHFVRKSVAGLTCRLLLAPVTVLAQGCMILQFTLAGTEPLFLNYATGYSLVITMTLFGIVVVVEFVRLVIHAIAYRHELRKVRSSDIGDEGGHRLAWKQLSQKTEGIGLIVTVIISAFCLQTSYLKAEFPGVRRLEVPVRNLPASFDGFRIVQLSDLHVGTVVGRSLLNRIVKVTNSLKPDMVVLTGDVAEGQVNALRRAMEPLKSLSAKYGVYLTPGNHDYYTTEIDEWLKFWASQGIVVLRNKRTEIQHQKFKHDKFYLIGLDDPDGGFFRGPSYGPKYKKALKNRDEFTPTILLAHRPKTAKHAIVNHGNIQLAMTGHTHGGQIFPVLLWHYFTEPFFKGLHQLSPDTYIYVSTGVFYYAAPMRIWSRGEIVEFTLTLG